MTKLLALRVKTETAAAVYELAGVGHRNPGQQLDLIIEEWLRSQPATAVVRGATSGPVAPDTAPSEKARGINFNDWQRTQ